MALQELTHSEVMEVSGGDIALGTIYQYTGNDSERNVLEVFHDVVNSAFDWIFRELLHDKY